MVRSRLAYLALALGLGLLSGCMCFRYPLFGRHCAPAGCGCDGSGAAVAPDGALTDGAASGLPGAGETVIVNPPSDGAVPLAPPPRLVPQAQGTVAPPAPYFPR
jgi:hypothetical protein